jgi:hypothetical protein
MADHKKWFKVWSTILIDPHHTNLDLASVGRWTRLGAMMVSAGDAGSLEIIPPAKSFLVAMDCANLDAAKCALKALPNVQIEEGKSDNGSFIVIIQNWFKYQVDSTSYERLKRSRCKRRGEEKRGEQEEKRGEVPPKSPTKFQKPTPQEATAYADSIGFRLDGEKFCAFYESKGWLVGKSPMKDWRAAVVTWKKDAHYTAMIQPTKAKEEDPKPEDCISAEQFGELTKSLALKTAL